MKFKDVEATFICQLNKPENRTMLEGYIKRRDKSGAELARYYIDVIYALKDTEAWGVSGVNEMLNELTTKVEATRVRAKRGKTSAYAHARWLLNKVDYFLEFEANPYGSHKRHKLNPLLTADQLVELSQLA